MPAANYLSAAALSQQTAAALDSLERGETEKLIILENDAPKAVLLSFDAYEALEEELEDLRLASLAFARLKTFKPEEAVPLEEMTQKFLK